MPPPVNGDIVGHAMRLFSFILLLFLFVTGHGQASPLPQDSSAAVIFAYQRIGEDEFPAGSLTLDQFRAHIRELKEGGYNVMPLPEIVKTLKNEGSLPPLTVALTFDGGHKSVVDKAVPLLLEAGFPFTVFVATDSLDEGGRSFMSWADVKRLARNPLATVGIHPSSYIHVVSTDDAELRRQINKARSRLREETGTDATLFSYPFGEFNADTRTIVASSGFAAAVGFQSGVSYAGVDLFSLPRFVMTEGYGDDERFRMTARALPLPVIDKTPVFTALPSITGAAGFTITDALADDAHALSCFSSDGSKPQIKRLGKSRIEIRLDHYETFDRIRINCTLPAMPGAADEDQRWRWLGFLLLAPPGGTEESAALSSPAEE